MTIKPSPASEYSPELLDLVNSACLYIHTILGDHIDDMIIIGGLVPNLIIPQNPTPDGVEKHIGTQDLDLGLSLAIFNKSRYQDIAQRLRDAGLVPDVNEANNPTFQRWILDEDLEVKIDFLIPKTYPNEKAGSIKHLDKDFGAIISPGLELAFEDRLAITISGMTHLGEKTEKEVWVCGPGAYIILKANAFDIRGKFKDAYDLFYVIRNYGHGHDEIIRHLTPLLENPYGKKALDILHNDFSNPEHKGPIRVAYFLFGRPDESTQIEVAGFVRQFLRSI